jgi:hypothetical protein
VPNIRQFAAIKKSAERMESDREAATGSRTLEDMGRISVPYLECIGSYTYALKFTSAVSFIRI